MQRVIAHRGASAYAPENTLAAFEKASALGCNFIEFDVMLTADGKPFVFHDEQLSRTTNGQGEFGLSSSDYISSLDAGSWFDKAFRGERIPSLQQTLAWLIASGMHANIEIKPYPGFTQETTDAVIKLLQCDWPQDKPWPLISSFDWNALMRCRNIAPELPLGLLLDVWQDDWLIWAQHLHCASIHLSRRAATAARVLSIKQQGYRVYVYTVNRPHQAAQLFDWGVDAVFSDYPDRLL